MPGADNCQPASIQNRGIATPVQNRWRIVFEARLQSPRVPCIGAADHPDRARLPALDCLTQQKATGQQTLEPVAADELLALLKQTSRIRNKQIGRLPVL